jgi:P27 family predicted phage terminase small subunit
MGKRGPAPKPTAVRLLHGDRRDRINVGEPQPPPGELSCPDWLPARGRQLWDELAPELEARGVLTLWDADAFAGVCWWWATFRDAQERIDADGVLVKGYRGSRVKHPAHQVARDAWAMFLQAAARFGLTPSDRSQLDVGGKQAHPAERLLS